jgi:hypothetical protein
MPRCLHLDVVCKVFSDDNAFLLGLACTKVMDMLCTAVDAVAELASRWADPCL